MKKGFTLVELLITVGLFATIVTIAVGGFTNALRTQRQVASLISAQSNVSLALEQMSRQVRTGYLFCNPYGNTQTGSGPASTTASSALADCGCVYTPATAPPGSWDCNALDFYDDNSNHIVYFLQNGALMESSTQINANGNGPQAITSDSVSVRYLRFQLSGQVEGDYWTPRIAVSLGIAPSSTDAAVSSDIINLETTISARSIDCQPGTQNC